MPEPYAELRAYLEQHRAVWRCAGEQIQALEELLAAHQRPFGADLQRLQTIPGVGPIVAATVVAVFADVQRFPDAKHAASYAGLAPSTYQSGSRDVHGRITKRGSAELRAMLCEAAHHAARPQHPLHPYFAQRVPSTATSARWSPWPIGCVGSCSRCSATGATST